MGHSTIKIQTPLLEDARRNADVFNRSVGGQIEHWARLGRAIEQAPGFDYRHITQALNAKRAPASLIAEEQEVYFDQFAEAMRQPSREEAAFFADRRRRGVGVGTDARGRIIKQGPVGKVTKVR